MFTAVPQDVELNLNKLKYLDCANKQEHEGEQMNLLCVDPQCPVELQFQPFCSLCQDEDNFHNRDSHKSKNLKTVLKGIQQEIQPEGSNNQDGGKLTDSQQNTLIIAQEFQDMAEQLQQISDFMRQSTKANSGQNLNTVLGQIQQTTQSQDLTQYLKELRNFVNIDKSSGVKILSSGGSLNADYLKKMQYYSTKFTPHVKQCYQDSEKINENSDYMQQQEQQKQQQQQNNLISSSFSDDNEQEMVSLKQEVERLKQQNKNTSETLEVWKMKFKQAQNDSQNLKFDNNDGYMEALSENVRLKDTIEQKQATINQINFKYDALTREMQNTKIDIIKIREQNKDVRKERDDFQERLRYIKKKLNEDTYIRNYLAEQERIEAQQRQKSAAKTCLRGHGLREVSQFSPKMAFLSCDDCNRRILPLNCSSFRCEACDYDSCAYCVRKRCQPQQSVDVVQCYQY